MPADVVADAIPVEVRLAAVISLLSTFTVRGVTPCKALALRAHLEALVLADNAFIHPHLQRALEDALAEWLSIECHPASMPVDCCPLLGANKPLH